MSQLGRIGGQLLNPNLERNGRDLAFKNYITDDPILYLQVDPALSITVTSADLIPGAIYKIKNPGDSNWVVAGAPDRNVGTIFKANTSVPGTGDAYLLNADLDASPPGTSGAKVGINTDTPISEFDVNNDIRSLNLEATSLLTIDNFQLNPGTEYSYFTTTVGPINVVVENSEDPILFHDRLTSDNLEVQDNFIGSLNNANLVLDPNGTGTIEVARSTNVAGNLSLTGNLTLDGNLSTISTLVIGDEIFDTITVNTDFTQDIIPGQDSVWSLGENTGDSSARRWGSLFSDDWQNIDNFVPYGAVVSDQVRFDGVNDYKISTEQSNDDLRLLPDTGIVYTDGLKWENNSITNQGNPPLQLRTTEDGYYKFAGTNGMLIPAGNDSTRPTAPELGDTRWNTDAGILECFAGELENLIFVSGDVTGLPDQVLENVTATTTGNGVGANVDIRIIGGAFNVQIDQPGRGYLPGDSFVIPGTRFLGGTSPANDLFYTVGTQTNDGYVISTGGGEEVTEELMEDLGNIYSLILG